MLISSTIYVPYNSERPSNVFNELTQSLTNGGTSDMHWTPPTETTQKYDLLERNALFMYSQAVHLICIHVSSFDSCVLSTFCYRDTLARVDNKLRARESRIHQHSFKGTRNKWCEITLVPERGMISRKASKYIVSNIGVSELSIANSKAVWSRLCSGPYDISWGRRKCKKRCIPN